MCATTDRESPQRISRECLNRFSLRAKSARASALACPLAMRWWSGTAAHYSRKASWASGQRSTSTCRVPSDIEMSNTQQSTHTVVYVDDEDLARKYFARAAGSDYEVLLASGAEEAMSILRREGA